MRIEVPSDKMVLFCVGAQKSGTSWLARELGKHDGVYVPPEKEMHYFDFHYGGVSIGLTSRMRKLAKLTTEMQSLEGAAFDTHYRKSMRILRSAGRYRPGRLGLNAYLTELGATGPDRILCDFTPAYATLDQDAFQVMANIAQNTRFIFIMRDPVDRMWSEVRHAARDRTTHKAEFDKYCLKHMKDVLKTDQDGPWVRCLYQQTIEALEAVIPSDRIQYLFFESLFSSETEAALADYLDWPGLSFNEGRKRNEGVGLELPADIAHALRARLEPQYAYVTARFGEAVPDHWHRPQAERAGTGLGRFAFGRKILERTGKAGGSEA